MFIYFKVIDYFLLYSAVPRTLGVSVSVTVEGTTSVYKLPIAPLITGSHPVDNKGLDLWGIKDNNAINNNDNSGVTTIGVILCNLFHAGFPRFL